MHFTIIPKVVLFYFFFLSLLATQIIRGLLCKDTEDLSLSSSKTGSGKAAKNPLQKILKKKYLTNTVLLSIDTILVI